MLFTRLSCRTELCTLRVESASGAAVRLRPLLSSGCAPKTSFVSTLATRLAGEASFSSVSGTGVGSKVSDAPPVMLEMPFDTSPATVSSVPGGAVGRLAEEAVGRAAVRHLLMAVFNAFTRATAPARPLPLHASCTFSGASASLNAVCMASVNAGVSLCPEHSHSRRNAPACSGAKSSPRPLRNCTLAGSMASKKKVPV